LGREQCGYIYRNPNGSRENLDEYVYVSPMSILRYSVKSE